MKSTAPAHLLRALERSWPAAERVERGGLILRRDVAAAGSRVNSARLADTGPEPDPEAAIPALRSFYDGAGLRARFQAAKGSAELNAAEADGDLERHLRDAGFAPADPTRLLSAPLSEALEAARRSAASADGAEIRIIAIETPLKRLTEVWGGEGEPARQAVMRRAAARGPGGVLALRIGSRLEGALFWAVDQGGGVFLHALHVTKQARRRGGARRLIAAALATARRRSRAETAHAACLVSNLAAQTLFDSLGFTEGGGYFYWVGPE